MRGGAARLDDEGDYPNNVSMLGDELDGRYNDARRILRSDWLLGLIQEKQAEAWFEGYGAAVAVLAQKHEEPNPYLPTPTTEETPE